MTLRERCDGLLRELSRTDGSRRPHELTREMKIDAIESFFIAEQGRLADHRLERAVPLCLYFDNDQDRREFIEAVHEAKPGMVSRAWPR